MSEPENIFDFIRRCNEEGVLVPKEVLVVALAMLPEPKITKTPKSPDEVSHDRREHVRYRRSRGKFV